MNNMDNMDFERDISIHVNQFFIHSRYDSFNNHYVMVFLSIFEIPLPYRACVPCILV